MIALTAPKVDAVRDQVLPPLWSERVAHGHGR